MTCRCDHTDSEHDWIPPFLCRACNPTRDDKTRELHRAQLSGDAELQAKLMRELLP